YFPESIPMKGLNEHMSFDYLGVLNSLKDNFAEYIKIRSLNPAEALSGYRVIITGDNISKTLKSFIYKKATSRRINGYVRTINSNKVVVNCSAYNKTHINWLVKQIKEYDKTNTVRCKPV